MKNIAILITTLLFATTTVASNGGFMSLGYEQITQENFKTQENGIDRADYSPKNFNALSWVLGYKASNVSTSVSAFISDQGKKDYQNGFVAYRLAGAHLDISPYVKLFKFSESVRVEALINASYRYMTTFDEEYSNVSLGGRASGFFPTAGAGLRLTLNNKSSVDLNYQKSLSNFAGISSPRIWALSINLHTL